MWDAGQLVVAALPAALKTGAKPGTPEFRVAMRDALESIKDLPASQGRVQHVAHRPRGLR